MSQVVAFGPKKVGVFEDNYTTVLAYDGSNNLQYQGKANPGTATSAANWQIKKFTYDGSNNLTNIQFADGTWDFTKVWDSRTTYSYS